MSGRCATPASARPMAVTLVTADANAREGATLLHGDKRQKNGYLGGSEMKELKFELSERSPLSSDVVGPDAHPEPPE